MEPVLVDIARFEQFAFYGGIRVLLLFKLMVIIDLVRSSHVGVRGGWIIAGLLGFGLLGSMIQLAIKTLLGL